MTETRYRINAPQVLFEQFADEVVLVNLENGNYYSLNPSGSAILLLVARGLSPAEIARRCPPGDAFASAGVRDLVAELQSEGLITPVEDVVSKADDEEAPKAEIDFSIPPALQRFTDMQDLLLLDPIHDVDDCGWPNPAGE